MVQMLRMATLLSVLSLAGSMLTAAAQNRKGPLPNGEETAIKPILFPDGVVDSELRTAFVSNPKGGVQAIRLEDGEVLWTNDMCVADPWLVAGPRLIARGERLMILDLNNGGKLLRQCDAVAYPKVNPPERCTIAFSLWNPRVVGDTLEANWYVAASIDRSKGRPFAFQPWTAFNKAALIGTVKVNLESGKAGVKTDPNTVDVTGALMPEAAKPDQQIPKDLNDKLTATWRQYHKDQNGRIAILGNRLVGVAMTLEKPGQEYQKKVALHSWDVKTGVAAEAVELVKDKAVNIANIVLTEDRRHAAVVFGNSTLTIYSLINGKLVAKDVKGISAPEKAFVVDGKRLYSSQVGPGVGADSEHTEGSRPVNQQGVMGT